VIPTLALFVFGFVPQLGVSVERCGTLELNHVWSCLPDPWGGQNHQIRIASYWLGRRRIEECEDYWLVDWWRLYQGEQLWLDDSRCCILLRDKLSGRSVLVIARRFRQTWTSYDVEREQHQEITRKYKVDRKIYRRGLAGMKPK